MLGKTETLLLWAFAVCASGNANPRTASPRAIVYATEKGPSIGPGKQAVELLRFVTAYRTGLEAVVDLTPYAPLLQAAAEGDGAVTFYVFIDTWVDNSTGRDVLYLHNVSHQCSPSKKFYGNGWSTSVDLVLWPGADTRPRESVTLATGIFGSHYPFGWVTVHEGNLVDGGHTLLLNEAADLTVATNPPPAYSCRSGAQQALRASLLGFTSQQVELLYLSGDLDTEDLQEQWDSIEEDMFQNLVIPQLLQVAVQQVFPNNKTVRATFDPTKAVLELGMLVFYKQADVMTDTFLYEKFWVNMSYPFQPAGQVVAAYNDTVVLQLTHACLPSTSSALPGLLVPSAPEALTEARDLVRSAMQQGKVRASKKRPTRSQSEAPLLLEAVQNQTALATWARHRNRPGPWLEKSDWPGTLPPLVEPRLLGHVAVEPTLARRNGSMLSEAEVQKQQERVCVVMQQRQGRLFERQFDLRLASGDRVVMQLAVTGHGWAATSMQCGEYCYAVYQLSFNGRSALNVTEFRDDCRKNPINGTRQRGTWCESRNGWCPGSVEPGLFVDVTEWLREGSNLVEFDVTVWSNRTGHYEPYTDYAGFALGDQAFLTVGLSLFVYDKVVSDAVRLQPHAYSAAEAALRDGSSSPKSLAPAQGVPPLEPQVLMQYSGRHARGQAVAAVNDAEEQDVAVRLRTKLQQKKQPRQSHSRQHSLQQATLPQVRHQIPERFDFEARSPWYLYDHTTEMPLGSSAGAVTVPVFKASLVQGSSRIIQTTISGEALSSNWAQGALHLRLEKPPGLLEFDHWDREASVGIILPEKSQGVQVQKAEQRPVAREWPMRD